MTFLKKDFLLSLAIALFFTLHLEACDKDTLFLESTKFELESSSIFEVYSKNFNSFFSRSYLRHLNDFSFGIDSEKQSNLLGELNINPYMTSVTSFFKNSSNDDVLDTKPSKVDSDGSLDLKEGKSKFNKKDFKLSVLSIQGFI